MNLFAGLFSAGYDAVKSVFPKAKVIVHLDNGFHQPLYDSNLDTLAKYGAKWDSWGCLYTRIGHLTPVLRRMRKWS